MINKIKRIPLLLLLTVFVCGALVGCLSEIGAKDGNDESQTSYTHRNVWLPGSTFASDITFSPEEITKEDTIADPETAAVADTTVPPQTNAPEITPQTDTVQPETNAIQNYTTGVPETTEPQILEQTSTAEYETTLVQHDTTGAKKSDEVMVWIPTNGGTKYHNKPSCSNMKGPAHITLTEAIAKGFTTCKRCY